MRTALLSGAALFALFACEENETPLPDKTPYEATAPEALPCVPNLDGRIEARELAPHLDVTASYLVSPAGTERTVDLAGRDVGGKLTWELGVDYADDQVARIGAQRLDGRWYAGSFAGLASAFVVPVDAGARTEGVYTWEERGLFLHGLASSTEAPPEGKTLLVYATPIMVHRFPLENGASWSSASDVRDGTLRGLPYAGRDHYEVTVDGVGELGLPDFVLTQALRVRTKVTIEPAAGQVTTQRQVSFLFECLGEVARATSRPNEPEEGFTTASELRRLGLAR